MTLKRSNLQGEIPTKPHLALQISESEIVALPIGSKFFIVNDPNRADKTIPVFLADVGERSLTFRCNCGKPGCSRVLKYTRTVTGVHPER
jgi:hypothetical protein